MSWRHYQSFLSLKIKRSSLIASFFEMEAAGESSLYVPQVPHFYKFMLDEDIQTGKLIIPSNFLWKYGTHLCKSKTVLLKVPTGDTWEVELKETDAFRLEKGWPEFLHFYTIESGDLLIFRYESGRSNELDVAVCKKNCTEVGYPKKSRRVNVPPVDVEATSSHSLDQPAPLFVSEHPFFQVVMKKSYLSHGFMHVPIGFMRDHVSLECKEWAATLEVDGDRFPVKLIMTHSPAQHKASICGGFRAFRKKNSLEAGDTCTFELIRRAEMVFKVTISKANTRINRSGITEM